MKKIEFVGKVNEYTEYAKTVNVHQKPIEGVNSGAHGTTFEMAVKVELGNVHGNHLKSKAGRVDTTYKRQSIEIKSGAGELCKINEDGTISGLFKGLYIPENKETKQEEQILIESYSNGYVVYAPEFEPGDAVKQIAYAMTVENFVKAVISAGMLRKKTSTFSRRKGKTNPDRLTLQSFRNSIKKTDAWYDALENYGMTFGEWLEMVNNK